MNLATAQAVTKILEAISNKLNIRVKEFKTELIDISKIIEESLIHNIADELDQLVAMCDNKELEIAKYKKYIETLEEALRNVK